MALPLAAAGEEAYASAESRLRNQSKPVGLGMRALGNDFGIAPLRATAAPPPTVLASRLEAPVSGSTLVDPPPSGRQLLGMLGGSTRDASALTAFLGAHGLAGSTSMGILQARLSKARTQMQINDDKARFLLASRVDARSNAWFRAALPPTQLDLSG